MCIYMDKPPKRPIIVRRQRDQNPVRMGYVNDFFSLIHSEILKTLLHIIISL
jgi:hypothetical protein